MAARVFLLSPANCRGARARQVLSPRAAFPLAERLQSAEARRSASVRVRQRAVLPRQADLRRRFAAPPETDHSDRRRVASTSSRRTPGCATPDTLVTGAAIRAFASADVHHRQSRATAAARAQRPRAGRRDRPRLRGRAARQHRVAEVRRRPARGFRRRSCGFRSSSSAAAT